MAHTCALSADGVGKGAENSSQIMGKPSVTPAETSAACQGAELESRSAREEQRRTRHTHGPQGPGPAVMLTDNSPLQQGDTNQ